MREYQFYFLTDQDRDVERQDHCCMNDREAVQLGRKLCRHYNIDIWQDGRRIARVSKHEFGFDFPAQ